MKKFIMSFVACLVVCCTFLLSSFEVNAATTVHYLNFDRPTTSPFSGYVEAYTTNGAIGVYMWTIHPVTYSTGQPISNTEVDSATMGLTFDFTNDKITFSAYVGLNVVAHVYIHQITATGIRTLYAETITTTEAFDFTFSNDFCYALAYGNIGEIVRVGSPTVPDVDIVYNSDSVAVKTLQEILTIISQDSNLFETYLPKLNRIDFSTAQMYQLLQDIKTDIETYYPGFNIQLGEINEILWELKEYILNEPNASDREEIDDFDSNSSSQSTELDSLNQQTQVQKPNIDDMSNKVDANLNMDIDANYGLLLSAFTSNNRILSMLLIVASVSLISYVFFGKR